MLKESLSYELCLRAHLLLRGTTEADVVERWLGDYQLFGRLSSDKIRDLAQDHYFRHFFQFSLFLTADQQLDLDSPSFKKHYARVFEEKSQVPFLVARENMINLAHNL